MRRRSPDQVAEGTSDNPTQVLRVEGLNVTFPTSYGLINAVNGVSLSVAPGEILGIVGESGSGKSVTARSIMRMLRSPGRIDGGSVTLSGVNVLSCSEERMRKLRGKGVGMVFQDPQSALNPVLTIGDQIAEALRAHGMDKKAVPGRVAELLEQVGIPDVRTTVGRYPHELSGGMRQRVVIAIALSNSPSLLIADEPTTALDVTIQAQILRLLADLRRDLGIAVIIITHDMGVVAELCDRLIVMYAGSVVETGPVEDVFTCAAHPYTAALLKAVPRVDVSTSGDLVPIPGSPPDPARLPAGCPFHPRCASATELCRRDRPELKFIGTGHEAACWIAGSDQLDEEKAEHHGRLSSRQRPMGVPVIEVRDLRVSVGSKRKGLVKSQPFYAVDGVSLQVSSGETLGLVGESGCGKSTLARAIVGMRAPDSGLISVDGIELPVRSKDERRQVASSVQYIFQDPFSSLNPRMTIRETLMESLALAGAVRGAAQGRAEELMLRVGLQSSHLDRFPREFSGGQRQRIGIARGLAAEPKILICDEPVSALDVSIQAQIVNLLEELRDELGLGYLFIAHDLAVVRHLSDRVAVMYLGRIVEIGDAAAVYAAPQHPYTAVLLSSSPEPTTHKREREHIALTGDMPSPADPPSGCRFRTRCPIGPVFYPEREVCITTSPNLAQTPHGQAVACHYPGQIAIAGAPTVLAGAPIRVDAGTSGSAAGVEGA